jgi:hypothetical protein
VGQDVQRCEVGSGVRDLDGHQHVTRVGLGVVDLDNPVAITIEGAGVEELVLGIVLPAPAVFVDELLIGKGDLGVVAWRSPFSSWPKPSTRSRSALMRRGRGGRS